MFHRNKNLYVWLLLLVPRVTHARGLYLLLTGGLNTVYISKVVLTLTYYVHLTYYLKILFCYEEYLVSPFNLKAKPFLQMC